jgi:hypothetical protein
VAKSIIPVLVFAVAGAVGCAESRQYFRPTEHVYGHTVRGESEAIYSMVGAVGPFGEAKVYSRGAFRDEGKTVVYVTIDLHNTSGAPIVVDPQEIRVDPVRVGRDLLHDFPPVEKQTLSIAPGAFGAVKLIFVLPEGVSPGQVSSFGLRWKVSNGTQSYAQITPFLETGDYYPGYYAPPGYGFAYGYGVGCSWADPWCRPPYGYGFYGVRGGPIFVEPPAAARPPRTVIHTR